MYRSKKNTKMKRAALAAAATAGLVASGLGLASASGAATTTHKTTHVAPKFSGHGPGPRGVGGEVTGLDSSSITVKGLDGKTTTFTINSSTVIEKGHATGSQSDLAVGEHVAVRPSSTSSSTAAEVDIMVPHLGGQVVSTTSSTIVVSDRDGFYRTINVSSSTTFTKGSASSSLADVSVGSFVQAEGSVDADHTTLDATSVVIGAPGATPPAGDGPMGPMGPMH
jgi:hypothetical protein